MIIIAHLIGITFFAALAASGYTLAVQIAYGTIVALALFISFGNFMNASESIRLLKKKKPLDKAIEQLLPHFRELDFDIKCLHNAFAYAIHALIAIKLLHAPFLAVAIVVASIASIITLRSFKEMMKHVENDPRYKQ